MTSRLAAAWAICVRDYRLWTSYRMRSLTTLFTTITGITLFYYVSRLVQAPEVGDSDDYFGYVMVGTVVLEVMTSTLTSPVGIFRLELMTGTFERMLASPFGPIGSIMSLAIFPALLGLATGAVTLVFAGIVFGLPLHWATAPAAIPVAVLAALSFAPFGILIAAVAVVFKQTNAGATFVVAGTSLVAGLYFPVSLLPGWIQWAEHVQPMTPAADLMRHLLLDSPSSGSAVGALLRLVGFTVVMLPVATLALRLAVERGRRTGTITEY